MSNSGWANKQDEAYRLAAQKLHGFRIGRTFWKNYQTLGAEKITLLFEITRRIRDINKAARSE